MLTRESDQHDMRGCASPSFDGHTAHILSNIAVWARQVGIEVSERCP